jgi:hypothetical protein
MPGAPYTHVDATTHRLEDEQSDGGLRDGAPFVAEESRVERGDDGVYTVRWYEVPLRNELSDRDFLERLIATRKLGPVVPRWIHLGPYVGIEYERIEPESDVLLRSRMFVIEGRVFHLWANNWIRRDDEPAAQRFLDSFELDASPGLHVTYDLSVSRR